MKHIYILLLLLALASLACSLSLTEPTANLSASLATVTAIPSPAATITTEPTGTASLDKCEVTAEALHLRNTPNIEGLVLAYLNQGDQLTILPDPPSGEWVKVMTGDNLTGWINSQYCER
jgi:uncharacterized protein YgiM (DUF1202 family)